MNKQLSIADSVTNWQSTKSLSLSLSQFYKLTGIKGSCHFDFSSEDNQIQVNLLFNKEPTNDEYKLLFNIINDVDKLLLNEYMLNTAANYDDIKTLLFKVTEDTRQISHKNMQALKDKKVV